MTPRIHVGFSKGGTKKTTTAINLALRAAEKNHVVLFIDLDGQGDAGRYFDIVATNFSSAELYKPNFNYSPIKVKSWVWKNSEELGEIYVVPASLSKLADASKESNLNSIKSFQQNIDLLVDKLGVTMVVFDTPPSLDINQMAGLAACTHTILPLSCDHQSCGEVKVKEYSKVLKAVKTNFNQKLNSPIVILTDVDSRGELTKSYVNWAKSFFGDSKVDGHVEHSTVIPNAMSTKRAPWYKPPSGNDRTKGVAYRKFIDLILARCGV